MLWTTLLLVISCGFCTTANAEEFAINCNAADNHTNKILPITNYIDLEMYVVNNKTLMETLAETFFTSRTTAFFTRRGTSQFVKITYNFLINNNKQLVEDNKANCSSQQITYIWSEAAIYIAGPKALYWSTLFAININEVVVTIELPCIFNDIHNSLLSRLTYLVC